LLDYCGRDTFAMRSLHQTLNDLAARTLTAGGA
jgi:hypothetical protein